LYGLSSLSDCRVPRVKISPGNVVNIPVPWADDVIVTQKDLMIMLSNYCKQQKTKQGQVGYFESVKKKCSAK
jgi:hypothetical protein